MRLFEDVFSDEEWRDDLDPELARKLEKLLKRIKPFEDSYKQSRHESIAQLWVAIAEVYIQVDKMNRRLIRIERLLSDMDEDQQQQIQERIQDQDLSESLREF